MAGKKIRPIRVVGNLAYIPLSMGLEAVIDAADLHLVEGQNWHASKDRSTHYAARPFLRGYERGTPTKLHRILLNAPPDMVVDHIDGDGLNCRRDNLRLATGTQNRWNSRKHLRNTSGFNGVSFHINRNCWQASIRTNGKVMYLGRYKTPEEAHASYCAAARTLRGEFARGE